MLLLQPSEVDDSSNCFSFLSRKQGKLLQPENMFHLSSPDSLVFFHKCHCAFMQSWFNAIFFDCTLFFLLENCWHFLWEGWELRPVVQSSRVNVSDLLLRRSVSSKNKTLTKIYCPDICTFWVLRILHVYYFCEFLHVFYLFHALCTVFDLFPLLSP